MKLSALIEMQKNGYIFSNKIETTEQIKEQAEKMFADTVEKTVKYSSLELKNILENLKYVKAIHFQSDENCSKYKLKNDYILTGIKLFEMNFTVNISILEHYISECIDIKGIMTISKLDEKRVIKIEYNDIKILIAECVEF